jgi:hypothetical protein
MKKCLHRYKKLLLGEDYLVYKCQKPGCSHYISAKLIPGKVAECWRCGNAFVVTPNMVRKGKEVLKLHCPDCTRGRKKMEIVSDALLERIFGPHAYLDKKDFEQ